MASDRKKLLLVDDEPINLALMRGILQSQYGLAFARSGAEALTIATDAPPDLILLDVMMPGMDGYEVCAQLKANPRLADVPVIFVTALGQVDDEREGFNLGAVDFIVKPISAAILQARVATHLRLRELTSSLQVEVRSQLEKLESLGRLKRYFPAAVVEAILAQGGDRLPKSERRQVTAVFLDLRDFTSFAERAEPEDVWELLRDYHAAMGPLIERAGGVLDSYIGDGILILFNGPRRIDHPALRATRMALEMQLAFEPVRERWLKKDYEIGLGVGIAQGYASLGTVGFEGRWDYVAIGTVINVASRICDVAEHGDVLIDSRVHHETEAVVVAEPLAPLKLDGISRPMTIYRAKSVIENLAPAVSRQFAVEADREA